MEIFVGLICWNELQTYPVKLDYLQWIGGMIQPNV
jgi:hypothetical protein